MKAILATLILLAMVSCIPEGVAGTASMEPAIGPLFDAKSPPIRVSFSNATTGSGSISMSMPDGEKMSGQYKTMPGFSSDGPGGGDPSLSGGIELTDEDWKALFGRPDLTAGQISGEATCTGDRGTVMRVQYVVDPVDSRGFGVGKDNRGNLFRLVFQKAGFD